MGLSYTKTKFACFGGYVVQAIINNFLPILFIIFNKQYGLSYEKLGTIIFINFAVQIIADISTPFVVKRLGFKKTAIISHFFASFGLASFIFMNKIISDTYWSIVVSVIFYAFGSGIIEVVISPIMEFLPTDNKVGNMAFLHSFYCWGQTFTIIITTILVKVLGYSLWKFVPAIWAIIPFVNMIFFCTVPVVEPKQNSQKNNTKTDFKKLVLIVLLMLCSGASEIIMCQWASIFAQDGLGVSKVLGDLLGPCAFAVLMGTGRVLYALLSKRISFERLIIICSIMCMVCYFVVGVSKIPAVSLIFCAFCGITVSAFWPGTLSYAIKVFGEAATVLFGIVALFGDVGCSLGPFIFGIIAERSNLNTGFLVSIVFPLLMFISATILLKENVEKT